MEHEKRTETGWCDAGEKQCGISRRRFLALPVISSGILLGALKLPPFIQAALAEKGKIGKTITGHVKIGLWKFIIPLPAFVINRVVSAGVIRAKKTVEKFSSEKRTLHHFVVRALPDKRAPLSMDFLAQETGMPIKRVRALVEELEDQKTFLYRHNSDRINWAYPVSADPTPHKVFFSTGEQINAA